MIHVLFTTLILLNIGCMFITREIYNFWNPIAIGYTAGLWTAYIIQKAEVTK